MEREEGAAILIFGWWEEQIFEGSHFRGGRGRGANSRIHGILSMYKAKTLREANQAYEKDYLLDAQNVTKE